MGRERHGATAAAYIDFRHLPVPLFHSAIIIHQPIRFVKGAKKFLTFFPDALLFGVALMSIGTLYFELIPNIMLWVFTPDERVIAIGSVGFRFVGVSFIPMVTLLTFPVAELLTSLVGAYFLPEIPDLALCRRNRRRLDGS